jgi:hypothetical protein
MLGLKIDLEFAAAGDIGMAAGIARFCLPSGKLAYSTHKIKVEQLQK